MSASRTARRIANQSCEECGRAVSTPSDCPGRLAGRHGAKASESAAKVIDGVGAGLRAAIERQAMWRSTLRENYDDFGQWLSFSDMYGLAERLGFATAEEAWTANPTIQGSTNPTDFKVVPDGEQVDLELSAALGWDPCEDCGSNEEPCDCRRRAEAKQPVLKATREALLRQPTIMERLKELMPKVRCSKCGATRLPKDMKAGSDDGKRVCLNGCRITREPSTTERVKKFIGLSHRAAPAARETLDMGDLVIKESPPSMGGMDVYRKGRDYPGDRGDLDKVTFLNERGMEELGDWITNAAKAARRIAAATPYFVGEVFMSGMRTDPRHEGQMGHVVIGGDRGDVWAANAHADERDGVEGVTLVDVEFRTTLDLSGIGSDELREEVEHVIQDSYDSVQEDTFMPTRSAAVRTTELRWDWIATGGPATRGGSVFAVTRIEAERLVEAELKDGERIWELKIRDR